MATFNILKDIPDLAGKYLLVTGATSGIGEAAVAALAQRNPEKIYLGARSKSRAEAAIQRIRAGSVAAKMANIDILEVDLSSFDSIKAAAARVNQEAPRLDVLQLNAGIGMVPPATTKEGYEIEFATNYVGHALLTQLLLPKLLETAALPGADVRVVAVSSVSHVLLAPKEGIQFDTLKTDQKKLGGPARYGQSKFAQVVFIKDLAKRYPQIKFASVHPGGVKSNAYSGDKDASIVLRGVFKVLLAIRGLTEEEGAKQQLWASFSKDVVSGTYYERWCQTGKENPLTNDEKMGTELWEWTDKELRAHGAPGWPQA